MSEGLTISIQEALRANQALGPETVEILKGGIWLTAEEAEKVREAFEVWAVAHHLSGHEIEVRDGVLALLTPSGKDETKVCTDCGRDLHGYKSYARARGLCRYCDGTAE